MLRVARKNVLKKRDGNSGKSWGGLYSRRWSIGSWHLCRTTSSLAGIPFKPVGNRRLQALLSRVTGRHPELWSPRTTDERISPCGGEMSACSLNGNYLLNMWRNKSERKRSAEMVSRSGLCLSLHSHYQTQNKKQKCFSALLQKESQHRICSPLHVLLF